MTPYRTLFAIKLFHTVVWAIFAGCIIAIPFAVHAGRMLWAALLIGIVMAEVLVIAVNRGSCPLTPIAARYTADRRPNFDIFLPAWLARYNKLIFGALFAGGLVYAAYHAGG
jgi:uncharacterized membrane protein